jgi:hypothetical protein
VDCMESIVWGNSFQKENDCWKVTTFCRDVLATPRMDEFGHGATPADFSQQGSPVVLALAVISGVLASIMVAYAMRGGCSSKKEGDYGDVQFSTVHTHEAMT